MQVLAGIDLAWQSEKNGSGLAFGRLAGRTLTVLDASSGVTSLDDVLQQLAGYPDLQGVAVDAPLIIENATGQRACERQLARVYGGRKASCHTSNLSLYPDAGSVRLSKALRAQGFEHLTAGGRWQLECYPHPALIEIFELPERLLYKKGRVADKRAGQARLAAMLLELAVSETLALSIPGRFRHAFDADRIAGLRGSALKDNEDLLDAVVCLYIAGLYAMGIREYAFGDIETGYIYVPSLHPPY